MIGFVVYRLYTFKKELDHYAHLVTSEGDLTRKDYRILIPYIPENPDRLIRYGLCVAKKEDGEINILRVITVQPKLLLMPELPLHLLLVNHLILCIKLLKKRIF